MEYGKVKIIRDEQDTPKRLFVGRPVNKSKGAKTKRCAFDKPQFRRRRPVRTPAQDAERLAGEMQILARRLRDAESGEQVFTKADVDRFIEQRLAREKKRTRRVARERDELQDQVFALQGRVEELERALERP